MSAFRSLNSEVLRYDCARAVLSGDVNNVHLTRYIERLTSRYPSQWSLGLAAYAGCVHDADLKPNSRTATSVVRLLAAGGQWEMAFNVYSRHSIPTFNALRQGNNVPMDSNGALIALLKSRRTMMQCALLKSCGLNDISNPALIDTFESWRRAHPSTRHELLEAMLDVYSSPVIGRRLDASSGNNQHHVRIISEILDVVLATPKTKPKDNNDGKKQLVLNPKNSKMWARLLSSMERFCFDEQEIQKVVARAQSEIPEFRHVPLRRHT
eukprot:PhM_4_TR9274/c0_g1_i2/m.81307